MAQDPLTLLCVEPRFPGWLGAVADGLARRGYRCPHVHPSLPYPAARSLVEQRYSLLVAVPAAADFFTRVARVGRR
jgi:hypothetical protein